MFATSAVEVSLMKWIFEKLPSPISLHGFCVKKKKKKSEDDCSFLCLPAKTGLLEESRAAVRSIW